MGVAKERYVFISYSRTDQSYLDALVRHLGAAGVDVWTDCGIAYGARWTAAIREAIDGCAAFVVVMTPAAEESKWVEREVLRAEEKNRTILPLLLDGDVFFLLIANEYEDVSDGRMPSPRFIQRLQHLTSTAEPGDPLGGRPTAMDWADEGNRLGRLGRWEEALAAFEEAVELDGSNVGAHAGRGWALGNLGRWGDSLQATERAIEINPSNSMAQVNRSWALGGLERWEESLEASNRAIETSPASTGAHSIQAWALGHLGRWDVALKAANRAMELDPKDPNSLSIHKWVLDHAGKP